MKTLFACLVVAVALAAGYWKTQNPDASVEDLQSHASASVNRLKGGWEAIRDGSNNSAAANAEEQAALDARLNALEERLATQLQQTNTQLLQSSDDIQQASSDQSQLVIDRIADTERRLDSSDRQREALTQSLDTVTTSNQSVVAKLEALENQIKDLSQDLSYSTAKLNLDSKFNAVDTKVDLLNRRFDEQTGDQDIAQLQTELSALTSASTQTREELSNLRKDLSSEIATVDERATTLSARFNTLSTQASNGQEESAVTINAQIDQRIASLEDKLGTTNADSRRLVALSDQLQSTRKKVAVLEEQNNKDEKTIASLMASIKELNEKNESLSIDTLQTQIQEQLAGLQKQIESTDSNTDIDALNTNLGTTREQLKALERRVTSLPASSSAAGDAQILQTELKTQIAALEVRLSENQQTDPAIADTLSEVQQQVSQLAAKSYVTQEELQAQQAGKQVEYKIYFNRNSTSITEEAAKVLNSFIVQEKNRTTGVSIYGFTDRRGSASYNQQLALRRATNVRSYLIQNGFDFTKIKSLDGLGEDAAAIALEDGAEDAKQRSVVLFAAQP
jgi:outer membrane protein OmpA-like peptidoglycan-associated protein